MRKIMQASNRSVAGESTTGPAAALQNFKDAAGPETLQGLSLSAVQMVSRLLKIENPTPVDLQKGLQNPAILKRLGRGYAAKEIRQFAIEHGIYQENLSDLGMNPAAFKRAASLTGKPLPRVSDLLDWCKRRNSLQQDFSPQPGTTDARIEEFAMRHGHDNPALAYLGLGVRAVNVIRILYEKEVPGLLDLKRIVCEHSDKEVRGIWLQALTNCGNKTIFDIEMVISNVITTKAQTPQTP